jgi:hypothetical protein
LSNCPVFSKSFDTCSTLFFNRIQARAAFFNLLERYFVMIGRRELLGFVTALIAAGNRQNRPPVGRTVLAIQGDRFFINGSPTYEGRSYNGMNIEGLLMNSRMVQGIFDDGVIPIQKNGTRNAIPANL